jgi:GNAT superfamily N-acetyltransferase
MELRPAQEADVDDLARLILGDPAQPSTVAGMRLFALDDVDDALDVNRVMLSSTEGWRSVTVAEGPVGMVQLGEPLLALTPEVAALSQRLYGDDFMAVLGSRLAALGRVQAEYPDGCLRISEIHVDPASRGLGVGTVLFEHVLPTAPQRGFSRLGLQTLTTNPARRIFESWGFEVADTRTDAEFESFTGAAGYHLMLRGI